VDKKCKIDEKMKEWTFDEEKKRGKVNQGKSFLTRPSQILSFCAYVSEGGDSVTKCG